MVRENFISPANLVYPVFIHDKDYDEDIDVMPGCKRLSLPSLLQYAEQALSLGIGHIILFPKIAEHQKSNTADECYNPEGLVPRAVTALKEAFGSRITVWTDIALDPYSDQGHDGIVSDDARGDDGCARILNDETVEQLCRQALCHARAGADIVAPSDMMDGRVGAIRDALDTEGFTDISIVSYAAKYASAFYGPFRGALDSAPRETSRAPRNKKTYQMDPGNAREALREAAADIDEGADILLVKPGVPYLDIIHLLHGNFHVPIAAYHVSGEYAMIKAAAGRGWIDEKQVVLETLLCLKRAGATSILTYYALEAAKWMHE
jgi:porphobilinogen synthase